MNDDLQEFFSTIGKARKEKEDETNSEIILTKNTPLDGNPFFIAWGGGTSTTNIGAQLDDFFGGGDVGIALTTTSV